MTDASLTGHPAKNTGGDYPARPSTEAAKGLFVHYGDRRVYFGRKSETGRSLRRFFRVPDAEILYLENPGGEATVIVEGEDSYPLENGQRYFSKPIHVPQPSEPLPEAGGKHYPHLKEPGAETVIGEDGRVESDDAPIPDFGVRVDASFLGEIHHRLTGIESAVKQVRTVADLAHDEAKRARTLGEEAEAWMIGSAKRLDTVEAAVKRLETGQAAVMEGVTALLRDMAAIRPEAEPVFAGPPPEKPQTGPVVFYNGGAIRGLPAEIDDRSLREKMGVPFDDALIEVMGDGVVMERILDGEKIEITDGKRFISVPNPRFVPRR